MKKFPQLNEQLDLIKRGAEEIIPEDELLSLVNSPEAAVDE